MNIRQAAKKWGISKKECLRLCDEGMILMAVKRKTGTTYDYDIPDDTQKPPCFRCQAVIMLENIDLVKNESANPWVRGYSYKKIFDCYIYFEDCGFIAGFSESNVDVFKSSEKRKSLVKALSKCSVTSRGKELIEKERQIAGKKQLKIESIKTGGEVNIGPAKAYADIEMTSNSCNTSVSKRETE